VIANAAFLAAMTVFLMVAWLAGELTFLAPYKAALLGQRLNVILIVVFLLFLNLSAVFYTVGRWLFLRDTGRKLQHLDRQLATPDTVLEDLQTPTRS
jgi:hypothetical protein